MSLVAHKYTPAEMSAKELEATFAARGHTVDYLLNSLRKQTKSGTLSSFVITGPRGSGKSTIIQMVALRISQDPKLEKAWLPVVFPEEQFNIGSLRDLMAATLQMLAKQEIAPAKVWLEKVEAEANEEQSLQLALTGLREITKQQRKRLILFIENLNQLLEDCFDDQMKGTFRRLLMSDPFMMVIGSAVHVFESLKSYDEAFFNYFGQVPLARLTAEEVFDLLRLRGLFDANQNFLKELPSQQPKIRAIVLLSGGNPRLILMLYELLTEQPVTTIVQYLHRLVDELTPLLKHEIENLPRQQRLIINALMEGGGAAQPTDLVGRIRLPLNAITTQLGRLKEAQFVEVLGGGKGRTANYTVSDKLFAIWYQMRYLGKNRRRIEMFVEVLRVWFEEEDRLATLRNLASPEQRGAAHVLKDAATAEYFAASLAGTPHERLATELCVCHWALTDLREAALAYADLSNAGNEKSVMDEIQAYSGLGDFLVQHGDYQHAIQSLDEVILKHPRNGKALLKRGAAKARLGDNQGAISDLAAVVAMADSPKDLVALALFGRASFRGSIGDVAEVVSDYTAAIELSVLPKDLISIALVTLGIIKNSSGEAKEAIADYDAAIGMEGTPKEYVALALVGRGQAKAQLGNTQGAIVDYGAVIAMESAPKEHVARALAARGQARSQLGDTQGAMFDYDAVIKMGEPTEQVALALYNRGLIRGDLRDTQGEISDYGAVIAMESAPKETIAHALVNRGIVKGRLGDTLGAVLDLSTIIEMGGVPNSLTARALLNRSRYKEQLGDTQGAIFDCSAVIDMAVVPDDLLAWAYMSRWLASRKENENWDNVDDLLKVIDLAVMKHELTLHAADIAYHFLWLRKDYTEAKAVVTKLGGLLSFASKELATDAAIGFLSSITSPTMKDAWSVAWHILAETQSSKIAEALHFLKPVCDVLEGEDRTVLDGLPPEQREFAENVLKSFEAEPK